MSRVRAFTFLSSLLAVAAPISAQTIVVNGSGTPYTNSTGANTPTEADASCSAFYATWCARNVRNNSSVGPTTANPRSGNGSLAFSSPDGSGKADFEYYFAPQNQFRIKDISSMSYDWFRNSSSTNSALQVPAIRLLVSGPNAPGVDALIFEPYYQTPSNVT
ncbi:MAG: hypothetical protein ABI852_00565, partial [Gemmatimonadaceae bacterium]